MGRGGCRQGKRETRARTLSLALSLLTSLLIRLMRMRQIESGSPASSASTCSNTLTKPSTQEHKCVQGNVCRGYPLPHAHVQTFSYNHIVQTQETYSYGHTIRSCILNGPQVARSSAASAIWDPRAPPRESLPRAPCHFGELRPRHQAAQSARCGDGSGSGVAGEEESAVLRNLVQFACAQSSRSNAYVQIHTKQEDNRAKQPVAGSRPWWSGTPRPRSPLLAVCPLHHKS